MNRISRWIFAAMLTALTLFAPAAWAQTSSLFSNHTLAVAPAPMVFSLGIMIGLTLGFGFLTVGIRLSHLYR